MSSTAPVESEMPATLPPRIDAITVSPAHGYERWAPTYDCDPNPLLAREERHLLPLLVGIQDKRILDLACGTGRWLERLAGHSGCGVGIDCCIPMLQVAARKTAIRGRLAGATCEHLPFPRAAFDLAICSFAFGHLRDLDSVVGEMARVMIPEGDVFVSDLHPEAYARGWRVGFRDRDDAVQIEMLSRSADEILQSFDAHGFECITQTSLKLETPEEPIFTRAGKPHAFAEACRFPAILVCHFKRLDPQAGGQKA